MWVRASLNVQVEVYGVLQLNIERKPLAFLAISASGDQLISVQTLLDMLEVYYWSLPSVTSFGRQPLHHPVTGDVIGERGKS